MEKYAGYTSEEIDAHYDPQDQGHNLLHDTLNHLQDEVADYSEIHPEHMDEDIALINKIEDQIRNDHSISLTSEKKKKTA